MITGGALSVTLTRFLEKQLTAKETFLLKYYVIKSQLSDSLDTLFFSHNLHTETVLYNNGTQASDDIEKAIAAG